jgi:DNA-binding LytR/AlgR family response regulator
LIEIKAIIADDEEPLRTYLRSLLSHVWSDLIICGEARNGREALELVEKHKPHIAFLDIKMPGLSGMEVAKRIGEACRVVFVTAYDRYAVEAFENEAIDYLLKPVTRERLERAVKRLRKLIDAPHKHPLSDMTEITERIIAELKEREKREYLQWIRVQRSDDIILVPVEEVC